MLGIHWNISHTIQTIQLRMCDAFGFVCRATFGIVVVVVLVSFFLVLVRVGRGNFFNWFLAHTHRHGDSFCPTTPHRHAHTHTPAPLHTNPHTYTALINKKTKQKSTIKTSTTNFMYSFSFFFVFVFLFPFCVICVLFLIDWTRNQET